MQEGELFCGNSINSETCFDANPDHGSKCNQYFNISRIRSDNDFKHALDIISKDGRFTAAATNVGDSGNNRNSRFNI